MTGTEYHKLWAPFARVVTGKNQSYLDTTKWARPEFEILADKDWTWTEKVNGTNVRIIWDGHKVRIGGRTDDAQMPLILVEWLQERFPEELLESQFHSTPAVLYGEGHGARVVPGSGVYGAEPGFVLFDARVADWWLLPEGLENLAAQMGIPVVPQALKSGIFEAIKLITDQNFRSHWGNFQPEGLVGKPPAGLCGRDEDRLMVKIKPKDFLEERS